ncbi:BadF/BadG/BcrA/BcrD ATPase family protein [Saccharophagus degradans]|uniref:N-acetylglucosamine kinase n=1 Tax=Saccharophagus degradans TaxID=86304 RepID=UPI0024782146|nr:BadF/BadG/BcrA/BcrD ATPase family protein [Saccharophagus degradans]WGO99524.1 BadF/BadG/BcrA/BcrD ATPase family protein [Saccharophagus degradans]
MANLPPTHSPLFLGVDGGGTKCRAVLVDSNNTVLGVGEGGPANPYHGVERTYESIMNATDIALRNAGLTPEHKANIVAGLGLAGVHLPSLFQIVNQWDHPYKAQYLTTDLHIACIGAHESDDGAVMVAGTGSCGFSYVNGQALTLGAHGFPCGDKGSGAWLGLSAIQAVLVAEDELGPSTMLSDLVEEQLQARGLMIVDRLSGAKSSDYAKLAPLVFHAAEQGDSVALNIVKDGADYLSRVANKLWATKPPRMSLIGGVAQRMLDWMDADIAARMSAPLSQPEFGAVRFAKTKHAAKPQEIAS